jgi:hypothetical protein
MEWVFSKNSVPEDGETVIGWCIYPAGESAREVTYKNGTFWLYYKAVEYKRLEQTVIAWLRILPPLTIEKRLENVEKQIQELLSK